MSGPHGFRCGAVSDAAVGAAAVAAGVAEADPTGSYGVVVAPAGDDAAPIRSAATSWAASDHDPKPPMGDPDEDDGPGHDDEDDEDDDEEDDDEDEEPLQL